MAMSNRAACMWAGGATGIPGLTTWSAVFSISLTAVMGRRERRRGGPDHT